MSFIAVHITLSISITQNYCVSYTHILLIIKLEAANFELEQYRQQYRELENELARASEEQETLASQLYETGHNLDEANVDVSSLYLTHLYYISA